MENSNIEWTDHTFNSWIGCQKVSPGCDHCYAEEMNNRFKGGNWGPKAKRRRTSPANWKKPLAWQKKAEKENVRYKVFCASMADVFDNKVPEEWLYDLWMLIRKTPNLDWQLLTKRPQNIRKMLPFDWHNGYHNVWLGTTAENQEEANRRIPVLLSIPAAIRFLSCEPLLGPIDLEYIEERHNHGTNTYNALDGCWNEENGGDLYQHVSNNKIDWVIAGGESGRNARPVHPDWIRSLRDQCIDAGTAFFFKQWGEWGNARMKPSGTPGKYAITPREYEGPIVSIDQYPRQFDMFGQRVLEKVGKKAAGRLLDDRTWLQMPGNYYPDFSCQEHT